MSRDGSKQGVGILYFQLGGAAGAWMAQGFYQPEPDDLAALRRAIADAPTAWTRIEAALAAHGLHPSTADALVRVPKGFEHHAGTRLADTLRLKSLVVRRDVPHDHLFSQALIDDLVAFARHGEPLVSFGRSAIDRGRVQAR